MLRRLWPVFGFLGLLTFCGAGFASTNSAVAHQAKVTPPAPAISSALNRSAEFVDVAHVSSTPGCVDVHPPQALATPDPVLGSSQARKVKISFIIGTDGRVHSPLILESAGSSGDRQVLQTVGTWRYRPATCNGVPTEIEGKIEFSRH
jgi:TonB family protein